MLLRKMWGGALIDDADGYLTGSTFCPFYNNLVENSRDMTFAFRLPLHFCLMDLKKKFLTLRLKALGVTCHRNSKEFASCPEPEIK